MSDPLLWEPAIYEHKAELVGKSPADVAQSADLLAKAMVAEYEAYRADLMTVGIDIYNIEAEACGAKVSAISPTNCPEIESPLWRTDELPELRLPEIPAAGRFCLIGEAGLQAKAKLEGRTRIRVGVSGPVSIAAKLVGCEDLIIAAASDENSASRLLDFSLEVSTRWCQYLRGLGLDVIVFDSFASPPNFSPQMYHEVVLPLHNRLMKAIESAGQTDRPLVMGGNTTSIAADLCRSGATTILCDFAADAREFAAALPCESEITVRRNVSPQALSESADLEKLAADFLDDLRRFDGPIAGTGILPYGFRPELYREFREQVSAEYRNGSNL